MHVLNADADIKAWDPKQGTNIWELSGLFEGDIMLHKKKSMTKNGLVDMAARWNAATIPYYIDDSFSMIFVNFILVSLVLEHILLILLCLITTFFNYLQLMKKRKAF